MRKFRCLLFLFKEPYICYYIIFMTVPVINLDLRNRCNLRNIIIDDISIVFLRNFS